MLRTVFREIGRSLLSHKSASAPVEPHVLRQQRYAASTPGERAPLQAELRGWLEQQPGDLVAWTMLGDWLLQAGDIAAAINAYRRALQIKPLHSRAHEGLGLALLQSGNLHEAYLRLESASKLDPGNAEIWIHWGLVDLESGNLDQAAGKFQRAAERSPSNPHAWHNLGLVALKQGAVTQGIEYFQRSIELKPDHGLAYSNLALAQLQADQLDAATQNARRATELKRNNARVWVVLADVQIASGAFDEAQRSLEQASTIDARHVGSHIAWAKLHASRANHIAARRAYEEALAIDPDNAEARAGLGQLTLLLRDWAQGWDLYESRRHTASSPVRPFPYAEWQGENVTGQTVLVHAEQGLGDIILFASCLADLQARGARCVVEVPERLQGLFARSFPDTQVIGHEPTDNVLGWLNQAPAIDRHVPFGSLPRWVRRKLDDFPDRRSYLRADAVQTSQWRQRLRQDERPVIGVAWRGGLAMTGRFQRSMQLRQLLQAISGPDVRVVNLQYGEIQDELDAARREGIDVHPGISGYASLDDLAALVGACDGVVTVCSTLAHLTGAMGIPGLILVPHNPNWRYGAQGSTVPWYPSLTLTRQHRDQDWSAPLQAASDWVGRVARQPTCGEPSSR